MKINKNIPIADRSNRKYDFAKMEIGDSHVLEPIKKRHAIFSALRVFNKKHGTQIRITTRKVGHTVIFWRIE